MPPPPPLCLVGSDLEPAAVRLPAPASSRRLPLLQLERNLEIREIREIRSDLIFRRLFAIWKFPKVRGKKYFSLFFNSCDTNFNVS
jgi:hypothetical protein